MAISNPEDRKKFMNAVHEGSNSLTRITSERELLKDIVADLSEKFEMSKRQVNKIIRTYYKQSFTEETQSFEEFAEHYVSIVQPPTE